MTYYYWKWDNCHNGSDEINPASGEDSSGDCDWDTDATAAHLFFEWLPWILYREDGWTEVAMNAGKK